MPVWSIVLLSVLGALIIAVIILYFYSKKATAKRQEEMEAVKKQAMTINCYVIDKKKMRIKDAGFPKVVYDSAPRMTKISRVPVLKVKMGNKVTSLMCDPEVFKTILPKQEIRAQVTGVYVVDAKRIRGPVYVPKEHKKKSEKMLDKLR